MNKQLKEHLMLKVLILQEKGELPEFFTTAGWQLFKAKYLSPGESAFERYDSIA